MPRTSAALRTAFADLEPAPTMLERDALQAGLAASRAAGGGGGEAAQFETIASLLAENRRSHAAATARCGQSGSAG